MPLKKKGISNMFSLFAIYWSMFYGFGFGVGADAVVYVGKSAVKSAFNILLGVCVKLLDCPVI